MGRTIPLKRYKDSYTDPEIALKTALLATHALETCCMEPKRTPNNGLSIMVKPIHPHQKHTEPHNRY